MMTVQRIVDGFKAIGTSQCLMAGSVIPGVGLMGRRTQVLSYVKVPKGMLSGKEWSGLMTTGSLRQFIQIRNQALVYFNVATYTN